MREEDRLKERLAGIERELLHNHSKHTLAEIWQLKKDHRELARTLKRIIAADRK